MDADDLLDLAAERSRAGLRTRLSALRLNAWPIGQTAIAAAIAWFVATEIVGHARPFFAPVSACICLGVALGQRGRRAMQVALGVAVGVFVGDLLVLQVGTGTLQVGVGIALAMTVAVLLSGGQRLLVSQAAVSAALVATLQPPHGGVSLERFVDALVGGGVGLSVSLLFPVEPIARLRRACEPVLEELAGTLHDIAAALERGDHEAAEAALDRARDIEPRLETARDVLLTAAEVTRFAPSRRRARGAVRRWSDALTQVDLAIRNTRVLARSARRAIALDEHVPPRTPDAIERLALAVEHVHRSLTGGGASARDAAVDHARRAAAEAADVLEQTGNMSVSAIVGQVRFTAVDLLRSLGMGQDTATHAVRSAVRD